MATEPQSAAWERVTLRGQLVYWRRRLPDRSYLAVAKMGRRWQRAHRGPGYGPGGATSVHTAGARSTSRLARGAADRHIAESVG